MTTGLALLRHASCGGSATVLNAAVAGPTTLIYPGANWIVVKRDAGSLPDDVRSRIPASGHPHREQTAMRRELTRGKARPIQAASASRLSHAERPCGLAFLRYPAFSSGVQRNSTRAVAGFLMGGLPRGRFGLSIADIVPVQIILDKPPCPIYSVRTLNTEIQMLKSMAALKRAVKVGVKIEVLGHWRPELVGEARVVTKAQGNGYWHQRDGKRLWAEYPKSASEIVFNDDGSFSIVYGEGKFGKFRIVDSAAKS